MGISHIRVGLALKQQGVSIEQIAACLGRDKFTVARALKDLQPSPVYKALQA
jgi:predicted transcriptional regulator